MGSYDHIEKCLHSVIQHGPSNQRAYLMKLDSGDVPDIIPKLNELATMNGYTKIFVKLPRKHMNSFLDEGYCSEAQVPGLWNGEDDGVFMSYFLDPRRRVVSQPMRIDRNVALAQERFSTFLPDRPISNYQIDVVSEDGIAEMVSVYQRVFPSYSFPITEANYHISGQIESMNVWYKRLTDEPI